MVTPTQLNALQAMGDRLRLTSANFATAASTAEPVYEAGPATQILARLGAHACRQAEVIASLATSPEYLAQISQLVRGMLEVWFRAAWLSASPDQSERLRRALGLDLEDIRLRREKLAYQAQFDHVGQEHFERVEAREEALVQRIAESGVTHIPNLRQGMEGLGQWQRYVVYRWESDFAHFSLTGLGQLTQQQDGVTLIGGPGSPSAVAARLANAWSAAKDIFEIVREELGLSIPGWEDHLAESEQAIHEALHAATGEGG